MSLTTHILAFLTVLIVGTVEGLFLHFGIPSGMDGVVVGRILGTMDSSLMLVLSYYFGSSSGSDRKNILLANSVPAPKQGDAAQTEAKP